jgi:hypothetical protein
MWWNGPEGAQRHRVEGQKRCDRGSRQLSEPNPHVKNFEAFGGIPFRGINGRPTSRRRTVGRELL